MSYTAQRFNTQDSNLPAAQARDLTGMPARRRISWIVAIFALVFATTVFSVPLFHRSSANNSIAKVSPVATTNQDVQTGNRFVSAKPAMFPTLMAPLPPVATEPTVTIFDSDCTTPRSLFSAGDTVCAHVDGVTTSTLTTHIDWANPTGAILSKSTDITTNGSNRTFTLSATASIGTWRAILTDKGSVPHATAEFFVSDANNKRVDLSVNNRAQSEVTPGSDITYRVVIFNNGPDTAENVVVTEPDPANTSYVTTAQLSGPTFSCSNGTGTTLCTISSMPANTFAILSTTYTVPNTVPNGTTITSSVSVGNDVVERNADDNSASIDTVTSNGACVVTCGDNITVQAEAGTGGAVVTYTAPTGNANCGTAPISCSQASGSFFKIGTTPVTCVGDTGDACSFTVTVENPGGLSITLNGDNPFNLECGSVVITPDSSGFNDPGASAINGTGDPVPVDISGSVDTKTPGTYTVTYTATEGENSVSTTRTVIVADTTKPAIDIEGANPYKIQQGSCSPFSDPGAHATDGCAGPVAVTRSISGPGGATSVDNNTPGTYTVTYSATDGTHPATATRTVLVGTFDPDEVDQPSTTGPPTITLNGDDQMTVECGSSFTDPGATASACGGSVPVTTSGTVDTHTTGVYTITYSATTTGGTTEATRTVTVVDTTPAVITLNGANPMTVECHSSFTDPGATADDACAGSLPVTATGTVDPNTPGTYTITYSAPSDPAGNPTQSKTRTVVVADTLAPVITINGDNPATVECHTSYSDAGATANDACTGPVSVTTSGSVNVNVPGTYTITYTATDGTHSGTATRTVIVADTTPPTITLNGSQPSLWPANHSYQTFNVTDFVTSVSDSCDTGLGVGDVVISQVTSDETVNGNGDGNTLNDIVIASGCKSVQLRAERQGTGNGRVYTITFLVRDASGKTSTATARVVVPHNPGETPVDSGPSYTVTGCP